MASGIAPLDARIGGLRSQGLYLVAGAPGSGRLVALMQFLAEGLSEPGTVHGLVTAAPPSRIFDEARYWGFPLEEAWREGRLRLLTLGEDFERRLTSSADPTEVYEEMGELLGTGVRRIALYPGTPLWDTRSGTSFASRFLRWIEGSESTVVASMGGSVDDSGSPATEWVLQAAAGIFEMEVLPDGLRRIGIRRLTPAPKDDTPIEVDLSPGEGIVAATPATRLRRAEVGPRGLLLLALAGGLPAEIRSWAEGAYEVNETTDALTGMERLEADASAFRVLLIHIDRRSVGAALRATRLVRRLSDIPILVLSDDPVRSSDRLAGLQAGANDFLTGPIAALELASRIDQAVIAGGRPAAAAAFTPGEPPGGNRILGHEAFIHEVDLRFEAGGGASFTLVRFTPGDDLEMWRAALATIRADQGDRVGVIADGIGVLLHGTPIQQVPVFVERVKGALGSSQTAIGWESWGSTVHPEEIRELLARPAHWNGLLALQNAS